MTWQHHHQHHHSHHYHQDPEIARQARRAADIQQAQLDVQRQRFEHEQQVQRARDLGITHEELLRRIADAEHARQALRALESEESLWRDRVERARLEIRNKAWWEKWRLYWRNRWNWMRHPGLTRQAIAPHVAAIEPRIRAQHQPLMQAQQQLATFAPQIQAAQLVLAQREARL